MAYATEVKYFDSKMVGTPVMSGTYGTLLAVLDACLVTGFNLKTVDSLVVAGGVATATVSTGHGMALYSVILIAGATPAELNGEKRVTWIDTNTLKFDATGIADTTATGTITMKMAPAGWEKPFSGTNKAVFRSPNVECPRHYFRFDDTATMTCKVRGYETMTDVDTGTGYTQTWNITDWLLPANTFSLHGAPASVAGAVAEASGSVLSADRKLRNLKMQPRYPVKPWDWATATPDYVIPSAVAQTESLEWLEKPSYNAVYVSGVQEGVLGHVKITGTAGDLAAPMVTHPLITHADAARQRGISILGDTGRKAMMQISMPVLESTGVIDICKLIEFSDGANTRRGIVRANNISVNWPTVRQTLTVEAAA